MNERRTIPVMWVPAFCASLALFAVSLLFGDLNQDEGWYLYASRLVARGQLPFVDFASTQGPMMPVVYVLAQPLVKLWGLAGGRVFTAILGLLTAFCSAWLASMLTWKSGAAEARSTTTRASALMAFLLVGTNLYQVYFTTVVKTYALAGLFIVVGFILLIRGQRTRSSIAVFFSGVLLALATATRSSAVALLPVVFVFLLLLRRIDHRGEARAEVAWAPAFLFALGGLLGGCVVFLPFLLKAPTAFWFGLVEYHAQRQVGGWMACMAYKGGFILRLIGFYFVPIALAVGTSLFALPMLFGRGGARSRQGGVLVSLVSDPLCVLWGGVAGVTALHILAPFPYDDYQVIIFPLFAAAIAAGLMRWIAGGICSPSTSGPTAVGLLVLVFVISMCHSLSSPLLQGWMLGKRDRIWWPMKSETALGKLRDAGRILRKMTEPGDLLLTQDTYLVVESGLDLPADLELGPFSYFPEMSDEKADAYHVLNRTKLRHLLKTSEAPVAAFSGYGLTIQSPGIVQLPIDEQGELWRMVKLRYDLVVEVSEFGQAGTTLKILEIRNKVAMGKGDKE